MHADSERRVFDRLNVAASVALTAATAWVHIAAYRTAGALWRDEVNSVNLAARTWRGMWEASEFDSFPLGFFVILKPWLAVVGTNDDACIRLLGLVVGLTIPLLLWMVARASGGTAPTVALTIFALNSAVIRYGDSIRAYGLAIIAGLCLVLAYEVFLRSERRMRIALLLVATIPVVHFTFYGPVFVLSVATGAAALALKRKRYSDIGAIFVVGVLAAFSMAGYVSTVRSAAEWNWVVRQPTDLIELNRGLAQCLSLSGPFMPVAWALAAVGTVPLLARRPGEKTVFYGGSLVAGMVFHATFLLVLSYPLSPWYFMSALTVTAVSLDRIVDLSLSARARAVVAILALIFAGGSWPSVYRAVTVPHTNVPAVAKLLEKNARADDLILVTRWMYAITFNRYYRGPARWSTIPAMEDHSLHRYDLAIERGAADRDAIVETVRSQLRRGGRVWIVSSAPVPEPGRPVSAAGELFIETDSLNRMVLDLYAPGVTRRSMRDELAEADRLERVHVDLFEPSASRAVH